LNKGNKGRL